ncbi:DUF2690 domain-containing protein [Streptomyces sp. NPDC090025]|uniref:helix-turn-helix domain-containing protein n=1 Tax=Streptomyces sp. NPDC090025 TaxID=3365922 RepID=UPI00383238F1
MEQRGAAGDLAGELLALKKASGSSFAQLSEKTHYAKSSWERWVNGKQFPPRDAVERLAKLCGTDPEPLLALWDAEDARRTAPEEASGTAEATEGTAGTAEGSSEPGSGAAAGPDAAAESPESAESSDSSGSPEPAGSPAPGPVPAARRRRTALWASLVLAVVLVAGATTYALGVPPFGGGGDGGDAKAKAAPTQAVKVVGPATGCKLTGCEGRDPKKMNCGADAITVRTGSIPKDLVIELRYSRACQAAWGRISFAEVGATAVVNNSDGAAQADVVHYDRDVYTPLVAAPEHGSVWVCAALPKDGPRGCTGRFIPSEEKAQP